MAYRQFVYYSLLEKMRNKIPKMSISEKKWLVFQMLCAVAQVHQEDVVHGDIKPENVLVTSYNQLFLTDIVAYKPGRLEAANRTSLRLYFGELDNQTRSYLAPERFVDEDDVARARQHGDEDGIQLNKPLPNIKPQTE